jgi:iron(II)-dependent oxidoreductase
MDRPALVNALRDAHQRTVKLFHSLSDEQLSVPKSPIINPPLWEFGHVAWFQEFWTLRHLRGLDSVRSDSDSLFDSAKVAHDTRWDLPLTRELSTSYGNAVFERMLERLQGSDWTPESAYFHQLALFHEDMHDEAFTYTFQTLSYPRPDCIADPRPDGSGPFPGDVEIPGGRFFLGALPNQGFIFDNEKWAHPVEVKTFRMARAPVTNAEFAEFVDAGGYEDPRFWSAEGEAWRRAEEAHFPVYWRRSGGGEWQQRVWDQWVRLREHHPVIHVNAYEAEAYCRWARRRLPTEAEWEFAASVDADGTRRRFPWGDEPPDTRRANLDCAGGGVVDVASFPRGDTVHGLRQMIGNVWEWTATRFLPYPGFSPDPYREYSEPWFATPHRVLRGGAWTTRPRLIRNSWRNFYEPHRRDVLAGFRTCAIS